MNSTKSLWKKEISSYIAITPALIVIIGVMAYPIISAFYYSFTGWDGVNAPFVGLSNYVYILSDPQTWVIMLNTFYFVLSIPVIIFASVVTAVLIYEKVPGWRFFRMLFFVPAVLSTVVIGLLFRAFFASTGPVNDVLKWVGLSQVNWFSNGNTAIIVIIFALLWASFGYGMLIFLAAMSNIDPVLYESAKLDGATWWNRLTKITIPLIWGAIQFFSVINVIYVFTSLFGFIYVMTSGGPGYATTTIDYYVYLKAFSSYDMGAGSALAFILFIIILLLTLLQFRITRNSTI